jgi:hypothetical protein
MGVSRRIYAPGMGLKDLTMIGREMDGVRP